MKTCSKCGISKPLDDYYKASRLKDGRQSACKMCADIVAARQRHNRKPHYQQLAKQQRERNAERYLEWKQQQKCRLCPEDRYQCLDLHHTDPSEKEGAIADLVQSWSWTRLQTELAKCVVVCRNCHALIHTGLVTVLCGEGPVTTEVS